MTQITGVTSNTYTKAQIAQILGMNYDSTYDTVYKGTNPKTGFKFFGFSSSGMQFCLALNGTNLTQGGFRSITGSTLTYEITPNLVMFSFYTQGIYLDCVCAKFENTNGTTGYCYIIVKDSSNPSHIIFDDVDDSRYTISYLSTFLTTCVDMSTGTSSNPVTRSVSLAPLIIQQSDSNVKKVKDCYLPAIYPPSMASRYMEFMLDNNRYVYITYAGGSDFGKLVVKGNAVS